MNRIIVIDSSFYMVFLLIVVLNNICLPLNFNLSKINNIY